MASASDPDKRPYPASSLEGAKDETSGKAKKHGTIAKKLECAVTWTSWLLGIALVILNNLILHFWKPWAGAYAGEKGKNLARKEDLEKILEEVREVTAAQKTIEARLSLDVWRDQRRWDERRSAYSGLLTWWEKAHETALGLPENLGASDVGGLMRVALTNASAEQRQVKSMAEMFLTDEDVRNHLNSLVELIGATDRGGKNALLDICVRAKQRIIASAQHYFGGPQ